MPEPMYPIPVRWTEDGLGLVILDQTALPEHRVERELRSLEEVEEAIRELRVRGAPLIGIAAAMAVSAMAASRVRGGGRDGAAAEGWSGGEPDPAAALAGHVRAWCDRLEATRPTAVNLHWALERMRRTADRHAGEPGSPDGPAGPASTPDAMALADALRAEADAIAAEDRETCRRIGEHALTLLSDGETILTHCNAGALATGGIGTALAPVYLARERGAGLRVVVDETRPLLQGSRLTAWELRRAGVDVTVITDGMAGARMAADPPAAVLVGADRIAANGDVANKVGTYGLAVLARHHGIPFYVLAPTSTVDLATPTGGDIPIEQRSPEEIRRGFGRATAPADAGVWSPAFDVTPADLVTAIVTERGVHRAPYGPALAAAVRAAETARQPGSGEGGAAPRPGNGDARAP